MRTKRIGPTLKVWLSANDTRRWAHRVDAAWPCSQLSGRRVFAEFDGTDLVDVSIDNGAGEQDVDSNEFNAIMNDLVWSKH